jgi:hypothetical protein
MLLVLLLSHEFPCINNTNVLQHTINSSTSTFFEKTDENPFKVKDKKLRQGWTNCTKSANCSIFSTLSLHLHESLVFIFFCLVEYVFFSGQSIWVFTQGVLRDFSHIPSTTSRKSSHRLLWHLIMSCPAKGGANEDSKYT